MASSITLFLLMISIYSASSAPNKSPLVGQLVNKNELVVKIGTPGQSQRLLLDLNAAVSAVQCGSSNGKFDPRKSSTFHRSKPGGPLFTDTVTINKTDGSNPTGTATVSGVPFQCDRRSRAALGRGKHALPTQLTPHKKVFTYCLPSFVFFGADQINYMPNKRPISPLLAYTPLLKSDKQHQYSVQVNGISFNGSRLTAVKPAPFAISSVQQYTSLVHPTYVAVRDAFRRLTIQRVPPVKPFDTCFNASQFGSTRVGPAVPSLELHMAGNTTWTWFGANTIALPRPDVACLAFVDAGPPPAKSVIGIFQQSDNLIRFDLEKQRFGFTGILYFFQTTCANFNTTLAR